MLAKVNELNKNVVILLSVGIIAITSIIITLIATSEGSGKGSADSLGDFQDYFVSEYGVQPNITVDVHGISEAQAETITKGLSKKLNLGGAQLSEYENTEWYEADSEDGDISVNAFFD
ncbi:hypothetical protein J7E79_14735 [Bacillus sp. ISL-40]|uniref:hypothetical protein n=1 Tax=unclassified Bacillus (in: firmicutes) TaxID=185979 RepID=UPI001BE609B9|nr:MULTISPECIES: hypothetical protein [unclassified Bacillus (in: firmicutes)]MBT2698661.1 hypothetical protein [Bacillus sp. ISL-40]MBT2724805.1 hypothetical protein [Bacillus sp. ISL-46]MBT2743504.1 hypothetical protein [Bacillus sp. ISL-77]